jgi:hypothetical protein
MSVNTATNNSKHKKEPLPLYQHVILFVRLRIGVALHVLR